MRAGPISKTGAIEPAWGGLATHMADWSTHSLRHAYAASPHDGGVVAGRPARSARSLGARVGKLPAAIAATELDAYRAYLGEVVTTVSPLLLRLCELEGYDLDDLVGDLCRGTVWEQWLCGVRPRDAWLKSLADRMDAWPPSNARLAASKFSEYVDTGMTIRQPNGPGIPFYMRVLDRGLEMAAFLGEHRLRTYGRKGSLTLNLTLPETIIAALPGTALDRFVEHPLLAGAGCVVTRADEPNRWGTKVRFALNPVSWRMPWAG